MNVWLVCVGEPLIVDGPKTRLRRIGNFADYLSENNCNVEFFSSNFDHYKKKKRSNSNDVLIIKDNYNINLAYGVDYKKNISIRRIINHIQTAKNIYNMMVQKSDKPDIIMTSMEPLEVSKEVVRYGKENNIPVVVDIRDLWPEIYYDVVPKTFHFLLKPYVKNCERGLRYTISNSYSISALSNGFLDYGLKYCNRDKRLEDKVFPIAYPNYNYESYRPLFDELWEKRGIKKDDFIITFLGNFGDQFDFCDIINVSNKLKEYRDIKFVLCGNGKNLNDVKEKTQGNNVFFPGWIEQEEISSLLCYSDIGIAPYIDSINYRLNTPNKFGEYMSASLPMLVSVDGEMNKLLTENECGHYYSNSKELEEKILELYGNKEILNKMKSNSRRLYDDMFNADIAYKKLYEYLEEVKSSYICKTKNNEL